MGSLRGRRRGRRRVRVGAADPTLTPVAGMVAVTELCERLDVVGRLDAVIGPLKQRRRGHTAGVVLVGIAAAQLTGEDFLVGLDRQRGDHTVAVCQSGLLFCSFVIHYPAGARTDSAPTYRALARSTRSSWAGAHIQSGNARGSVSRVIAGHLRAVTQR